VFKCEQILRRLDTRPAVTDGAFGRDAVEYSVKLLAQLLRCLERPGLVQIPLKKMTGRARDVAGDRVHRLDLASIPLGRARVDHPPRWIGPARFDISDADGHVVARLGLKRRRIVRGLRGGDAASLGHPLGKTAIEDGDGIVAKPP